MHRPVAPAVASSHTMSGRVGGKENKESVVGQSEALVGPALVGITLGLDGSYRCAAHGLEAKLIKLIASVCYS